MYKLLTVAMMTAALAICGTEANAAPPNPTLCVMTGPISSRVVTIYCHSHKNDFAATMRVLLAKYPDAKVAAITQDTGGIGSRVYTVIFN